VYGDHNRMTQYLEGATTKMNYAYSGRGEQVRKYVGTTNTYSLYDESGNWLGAYGNAGSSAPVQQVIWFEGMPVGVFAGAGAAQKLLYVEPDALGSPRSIIDPTRGASGTVIWKWNLDGEAFGNTAPVQDPDGDGTQFVFDLRFPGQRYDSVSGLSYNYFRDYDPAIGHYIESDPIGLGGGISTYGYVSSQPFSQIDPNGLWPDGGTPFDRRCGSIPGQGCSPIPGPRSDSAATPNVYPALIFALGGGGGPIGNFGGEGGVILALDQCSKKGNLHVYGYGGGNIGVSAIPASMYGYLEVAEIHASDLGQITGWGWSAGGVLANPVGGFSFSYSAPFFWQSSNYWINGVGYARGGSVGASIGPSYTREINKIPLSSLSAAQLTAIKDALANGGFKCECER
jgi:RHS repeat-associated protein